MSKDAYSNGVAMTPSGMGKVFDDHHVVDLVDFAGNARALLHNERALLLRNLNWSHQDFVSFAARVGKPIPIDDIEDGEDNKVMVLDGRDGAVVRGVGMLPLHRDGILRDRVVDMIMIYCPDDTDGGGSGRTIVCDQMSALRDMNREMRDLLSSRGLAYRTIEHGFFRKRLYEDWKTKPAVRNTERGEFLNLALPFEDEAAKAWETAVPGESPATSREILTSLSAYLNDRNYSYQHAWRKGDLLIFDNMRTLHGRTEIPVGCNRVVWRIQTLYN